MWISVKKLFDDILTDEHGAVVPDEFQLALAALLVHVAAIDGDYDPLEHAHLTDLMKSHFSLSQQQVEALIKAARRREADAVDIYSFTRVLTRKLDRTGRREVVEMLWEVAFADARLDEYESNLIWRASELLGVSRQDRLELKDQVRRRLEAQKQANTDQGQDGS